MTPKDWRHPKLLFAIEYLQDGEWRQSEGCTPFRDVVERRARAASDHSKVRVVTYRREKAEKRKFWGEWEESKP